MHKSILQRAWLRTALALGATLRPPITAHGQRMDPVMSAFLRLVRRQRRGVRFDLPALRARYAGAPAITGLAPDPGVRTRALAVAGRPAREYASAGPAGASMLYFHGGGFFMGGLDTHDALCRRLAAKAGVRIVAVEYRLAPEHPFPAAHEDASAAWRWALSCGDGPWLIGGDSAGANLAAGQALDGGPRLQVLIYPVVDMLHQDGLYPSILQFWDGFLLTAEGMKECARLLIPPEQDPADPRLSPIRAELGRASPALIVTAGFDPLRDQGRAYARALEKAGVPTHVQEESALPHGFADFAGVVPEARRAVDRVADAIRRELGAG